MPGALRRREAIVLLAGSLSALACVSAPRPLAVERPTPVAALDSEAWDALLRAHVDEGVVDYPALAGRLELAGYLDAVAGVGLDGATPEERLAFLINAYNAFAIAGILGGGSPATLYGRYRFFWRTRWPVAGEEITLWDLEHERIRPLGEARIHFALVCASASCPLLASEAYRPERLDRQLDVATRRFVNDPSRNRFDGEARVAHLSAIFEWYAEDFEAEAPSLLAWIARYVDDPALARELAAGDWRVRTLDYDWSLNGPPPRVER